MLSRLLMLGVVGLGLMACADETSAPDVPAFRQLNEQLLTAVETHCANASVMADMTACTGERDRYDAEARPLVNQMTGLSDSMDDCMMAMGRDSLADMQTTCRRIGDELTSHHGAACASTDLAADEAEAERHCQLMRDMAQHELDRTENMGQQGGTMSGMMSGGSCHD